MDANETRLLKSDGSAGPGVNVGVPSVTTRISYWNGDALPGAGYALTEVVHCKSKKRSASTQQRVHACRSTSAE